MEAIAAEAACCANNDLPPLPNKATVIMDAFLQKSVRELPFPSFERARKSRIQMKLLARAFRGRPGLLIRSLLAEAQFDPELKRASATVDHESAALRLRWS